MKRLAVSAALLLLFSCGAGSTHLAPLLSGGAPADLELTDVPFFPQTAHQCGPAALATVLAFTGVDVGADDLTPEVYLPAREGSLPVELAAAARRKGRIPYRLDDGLESLLPELQAGRPVLVFMDLGFSGAPAGHFAVVVGYRREGDLIIMRSGKERRAHMTASRFLSAWRRGGSWALVVLPPATLPAADAPRPFLREAAALEEMGNIAAAHTAFAAAADRWPDSEGALLGLGNTFYAQGKLREAVEAYRRLVKTHPGSVAGHNNLAAALSGLGCHREALEEVRRAFAEGAGEFQGVLAETEDEIRRLMEREGPECPFP